MRNGFTILELAVVLVIIAVMALLMAPAIGEWMDNYRTRQAARQAASDLQFARIKAISMAKNCTVTFNITLGSTQYDYIVYPDYDNDLELDLIDITIEGETYNERDDIFKRMILGSAYRNIGFDLSEGGGDGLTFSNNDDNQPSVAFDGQGFPRNNAGGFGAGTLFLINTKTNKHRQISVSSAGRISIQEY